MCLLATFSPYFWGLVKMLHGRKSRQTFLGLVFLGFALVIEAHCALVDTICLHSVSPPKPSGVVYTAKPGDGGARVKGWSSMIAVAKKAAQSQIPHLIFTDSRIRTLHTSYIHFTEDWCKTTNIFTCIILLTMRNHWNWANCGGDHNTKVMTAWGQKNAKYLQLRSLSALRALGSSSNCISSVCK